MDTETQINQERAGSKSSGTDILPLSSTIIQNASLMLIVPDDEEKGSENGSLSLSDLSNAYDPNCENRDQNITKQDSKAEILKLADRQDPIKESRIMMVKELKSNALEMQTIKEEPESIEKRTGETTINQKDQNAPDSSKSKTSTQENLPSKDEESPQKDANIDKSKSELISSELYHPERSDSENFFPLFMENLNLPTIKGCLKKRSTKFLHTWQSRYFVLKEKKMMYFKTETKQRFLGCLDFNLISARLVVDPKDPKKFQIEPIGSSKIFYFKTENEEETKQWVEALQKHINAPNDSKQMLCNIAIDKNFWKHDRIPESKFLLETKTGDILLFRSRHIVSRLQRIFTHSEYDHVALILKYSDGEIVLLEASGNEGVGLCRWSVFKKSNWHMLYEKCALKHFSEMVYSCRIVYRKLYVERTRELIEKVENFVKDVVGKKYSVTAKKLLQKKSTSIGTETPNDRTFFCSELVAACFKRMGLLPKEISSSQYLPGAFSADRKLPLLEGARLGDEYLLAYEL